MAPRSGSDDRRPRQRGLDVADAAGRADRRRAATSRRGRRCVRGAAGRAAQRTCAGRPLGVDPRGRLSGALDPGRAPAALAEMALALVAAAPPDAAVQAAAVRLLDPGQRVDELATALGFSERQLRRRFLAAVGYGPQTLQRVLRLRRFLASAGSSSMGWPRSPRAPGMPIRRNCAGMPGADRLDPGQLVGPPMGPAAPDRVQIVDNRGRRAYGDSRARRHTSLEHPWASRAPRRFLRSRRLPQRSSAPPHVRA